MTKSIEPAKMNALMHIGHTNEKPLVPMRMPYEAPRNRNPRQIGMVSGNAALSAGNQALVLAVSAMWMMFSLCNWSAGRYSPIMPYVVIHAWCR